MDHALIALSAVLLNAALAGPRPLLMRLGILALWHRPAHLARTLERKLNREHRSPQERRMRGFVLSAVAAACGMAVGWMAGSLVAQAKFLEIALLASLLPLRASWDIAAQVKAGLHARNLTRARAAFMATPVRHHALLDEYGLARSAIELLAYNAAIKIISPVLWYLLFGLPGAFISLSATLLFEASGNDDGFAQSIRKWNEWVHFLPVRLAGLLWLVAALFLPSAKATNSAQALRKMGEPAGFEGLSLSIPAFMLNLSLGGPSSAYSREWVGAGTPKPVAVDIRRSLYLFAVLHLLLIILLGLAL